MLSISASTSNRLLKKAAHCVLGRPSLCDVPQGYASVAALPAALLSAFLSSLLVFLSGGWISQAISAVLNVANNALIPGGKNT